MHHLLRAVPDSTYTALEEMSRYVRAWCCPCGATLHAGLRPDGYVVVLWLTAGHDDEGALLKYKEGIAFKMRPGQDAEAYIDDLPRGGCPAERVA